MTSTIDASELYEQLGMPSAPAIVDVRTEGDRLTFPRWLPCAYRGSSQNAAQWCQRLPRQRSLVIYTSNGGTADASTADEMTALGFDVRLLDGGIDAWRQAGYATIRDRAELHTPGGSRWVTRERPKIDRLACPWLVRRFIDPTAHFFYAPPHRVRGEAETLGAQPYDIADVTFSHRGPRCSFDSFLDEFDLRDPILDSVADIVRAADTGELAQSPQAPGLLAISLGLCANVADDIVLLEQAMPIYDALYAWSKTARHETHSWPTRTY